MRLQWALVSALFLAACTARDRVPKAQPAGARVEITNVRFANASADAVEGVFSILPRAQVGLGFDFFISQGADCPDCPAQIVYAENGLPLGCAYDGLPGTLGEHGHAESVVVVGRLDPEQRVFERTWKRIDADNCGAALSAFESADGSGGTLATYRVQNPIAPIEVVSALRNISGDEPVCLDTMCPAGMVVLSGGTEVGDAHHLTATHALNASTWRHCYAPEQPGGPQRQVRATATCGTLNGAAVEYVERTVLAPADGELPLEVDCPRRYFPVFVGGRWFEGWSPVATYAELNGDLDASTYAGQLYGGNTTGGNTAGEVTVHAVCVSPNVGPIFQSADLEVAPGRQCVQADCAEGSLAIGGFGAWRLTGIDHVDAFGPRGPSFTVCGVSSSPPMRDLSAIALCQPTD